MQCFGSYPSWGNYPIARQRAVKLVWRNKLLVSRSATSALPRGNGRSYGDSCLNDNGLLIDATGLDRFIAFDPVTGVLECEAGVLLSDILDLVEPQDWFLPVTPGTRFVTVAGAIANDVHGKNHHQRGCFSHHVESFELCRSDGERLECSETENADWFYATIGGLGLTGLISRAKIRLMRVESPGVLCESIKMQNLDDFFRLNEDSTKQFEYTVAWVDCLAGGAKRGRGLFSRGNHANKSSGLSGTKEKPALAVPFTLPFSAINPFSLRAFNTLYYHRQRQQAKTSVQSRNAFFYPLDGIGHWNRLYGRKGFLQYQCVIPNDNAAAVIDELLARIARSQAGSFLVVLKAFGDIRSRGMLSFARPGVTLAMDFPFHGERTLHLLTNLDECTVQAGALCTRPKTRA